jgi:hypothetical protein
MSPDSYANWGIDSLFASHKKHEQTLQSTVHTYKINFSMHDYGNKLILFFQFTWIMQSDVFLCKIKAETIITIHLLTSSEGGSAIARFVSLKHKVTVRYIYLHALHPVLF